MKTPKPLPPLETLKSIFQYDPDTGVISWRVQRSIRCPAGSEAGTLTSKGYTVINIDYSRFLAHRIVWKMVFGHDPSGQIDHINGVKTDNRICNLRLASNSQNHMNKGLQSNNTTGVKGVWFNKAYGKYQGEVKVNGKKYHAGFFDSLDDAAIARGKLAKRLHGEFFRDGARV